MKKRSIALILSALLMALTFTACNGDEVPLTAPESPTESSTVTPTAAPTATLTATPTPTAPPESPTPSLPTDTTTPKDPDDNLGDTFKELAKNSDTVVRGKLIEKLKEPYNQCRDANDPELPDEKEKILEWQFIMEITEVFASPKGTTLKVGDKITVNLAYEENRYMTNYKTIKIDSYFEPDLNQDLVMFLRQDILDKKIYYPDVTPFYFSVKDDSLFVFSSKKAEIEKFEKAMKLKAGEGAPMANLRKDLGVK